MRGKCPNTEFFLVRIFPHSDRIRRDMKYLFVFSPNVGKYEAEKTPYLDTFQAVSFLLMTANLQCLRRNKTYGEIKRHYYGKVRKMIR